MNKFGRLLTGKIPEKAQAFIAGVRGSPLFEPAVSLLTASSVHILNAVAPFAPLVAAPFWHRIFPPAGSLRPRQPCYYEVPPSHPRFGHVALWLQKLAQDNNMPRVTLVSANKYDGSPASGHPEHGLIYMAESLLERMPSAQLHYVAAHELGHMNALSRLALRAEQTHRNAKRICRNIALPALALGAAERWAPAQFGLVDAYFTTGVSYLPEAAHAVAPTLSTLTGNLTFNALMTTAALPVTLAAARLISRCAEQAADRFAVKQGTLVGLIDSHLSAYTGGAPNAFLLMDDVLRKPTIRERLRHLRREWRDTHPHDLVRVREAIDYARGRSTATPMIFEDNVWHAPPARQQGLRRAGFITPSR